MRACTNYFMFSLIFIFLFSSCSTVPVTGRRQLDLVPGSYMLSVSFQQYDDFLKTHNLSNNQHETQLVKSVGLKIQKSVENYMTANHLSKELRDYKWEFNLVEDKEINAWCMPGGKVVVYTGILPVTGNESGLAVVMGHEIAHAVAKHGNERMSEMLIAQLGGAALSVALKDKPEQTKQIWMTVFGAGAQLGFLLPYSRLQESEADRLGLIFMARAGYNPNEAVDFWVRMSDSAKGQKPPEFLSTHPSDETRIRKIKELLPEALKYFNKRPLATAK
ncbi:MAG: peptidase M48 [Candidatus Schekmanbacteria bacterium RBG_13_48_7]|uniref:Peptidase M48 n=1 Tax=Candidatus Schekmanbacteria bacterium RBG_13_48_7 TaxID=1817878 RepID=A0A1F7S196_9BACT|nr:MAG: peptidase M48 [Candidatus Schekmanbacteria bacterium RBG_13_48_7]